MSSRPRKMFDVTSRLPHSARSWKTVAMPRACAADGDGIVCSSPSISIRPESGCEHPGDHLGEGGLAGAVVADERHHLVGVHVQVDADEGLDGTEPQADLPEGQQRDPGALAHDLTCSSLGTYVQ